MGLFDSSKKVQDNAPADILCVDASDNNQSTLGDSFYIKAWVEYEHFLIYCTSTQDWIGIGLMLDYLWTILAYTIEH